MIIRAANIKKYTCKFSICFLMFFIFNNITQAKSLFNARKYHSFVSDNRARKIGDLLTVLIVENAKASGSAKLASHKATGVGIKANYNQHGLDANLALEAKADNGALTQRRGDIKATFSVILVARTKDAQWLIEGFQDIKINGEIMSIRLHGIIRLEDITSQNTILSSQIANASISYTGQGSVSESQNKGLLFKVLTSFGIL